MHGHCYAVLFLTQIHGELGREEQAEVREMIRDGVAVILDAQTRLGGWYYQPRNLTGEDEASLTICALQALRAANGIGIGVSKTRIDRAIEYIRKCKTDDGSFRYSLTGMPGAFDEEAARRFGQEIRHPLRALLLPKGGRLK